MTALLASLPLIPFGAALVGLLLRGRRLPAALAVVSAAATLVVALSLLSLERLERTAVVADFVDIEVTAGVRATTATVWVAVTVAVVALAVQLYSVAYLHDDERYAPYAAQVSLFTAAMLLVVVSADLVQLLVGWEVMGICSYLLIGHDRRLPEAPRAAVKAFLVTRVGDVGFLLGIALLGVRVGSFRIDTVLAADLPAGTRLTVCLLLLAGVAGKSAQFPLHTWLPDAMAGPTPISALIHAATMVAAGVYVVAVLYPLFAATPVALTVLGIMAVVTMLLGALAATAQADMKRVLAWSTVSQLGYMTGALAVGVPSAALFHLLTHAAFKALLFLAAGAVIHAIGSNLIADAGGLRRSMPVTFVVTTIGLAALVGVPPFAGFWSKEAVLAAALHEGSGIAWVVYGVGVVTVAVTGWYATRLWLGLFFGPPRASSPHEPPALMRGPVVVLAVPAALLGFVALAPDFSARLGALSTTGPSPELGHLDAAVLVPLLASAFGVALAWLMWRRDPAADPAARLPGRGSFASAFYLDAVQDALVTRPVLAVSAAVLRADESGVGGAVRGIGRGSRGAGGRLALLHRAPMPRAATAALAGALVLGVGAVVLRAVL
ncbi:NADH dehydrogenase [Virgisporangium aliadipatigenens]|uniref:NADH dehydrogenase n=1 Tax=Virgisporangium aliadipatigenens TaxID=741659 RepID=A0A8J3YI44_9ACTN|nr:NADH-quinone oxidoreductase subunit L [Virgisporangium aliadipatigenens]GIJ44628.1 NADH dehydrogenase [Virgisporangium aliadipatigenens]